MYKRLGFNKGQIMGEYALTFFIVSAVIITMSVFMVRVFQARIFDARRYMVDTVKNAAPHVGKMKLEYEPYYTNSDSYTQRTSTGTQTLLSGVATGRFHQVFNETTSMESYSTQLPPKDAD